MSADIDYFKTDLVKRGIHPVPVSPTYDGFFDALREADWDVLHISCHGEAVHGDIGNARLIIGDEIGPGGVARAIELEPTEVKLEAGRSSAFGKRRPLVFLNGCETGRLGAVLTAWGGWPKVFTESGASVFVGTSWPVRDVPASKFAKAFYDALLAGDTLAEAAKAARSATRAIGDASWLAFKVYGHPRARRV